MNKQREINFLKDKINTVENEIGVIKTHLENLEPEKPIKPDRGWLKKYVRYWFINIGKQIVGTSFTYWVGDEADQHRLNHNNVFQTEEEAERFLRIETKIFEIQNKNPVDWEDGPIAFFPFYNVNCLESDDYSRVKVGSNKHYSTDENFIPEIKQSLSSADIDFYFRRV